MIKKVALICIVLVCAAVLTAGSLSINTPSPHVSASSSSNKAVQSTPTTSVTHVASNTSINPRTPSALTANQLLRRQSYSGPFCASSKSLNKKYHYPGCFEVANIEAENLITFNTLADACAAGYKPCLRCNPPPCNGSSPGSIASTPTTSESLGYSAAGATTSPSTGSQPSAQAINEPTQCSQTTTI